MPHYIANICRQVHQTRALLFIALVIIVFVYWSACRVKSLDFDRKADTAFQQQSMTLPLRTSIFDAPEDNSSSPAHGLPGAHRARSFVNNADWTGCGRFLCRRMAMNGSVDYNDDALTGLPANNHRLPLCSDILMERLVALQTVLRRLRLPFHIAFGTLLGSIQQRDIFGWTSDLDIAVPSYYLGQFIHNRTVHLALYRAGFIAFQGGMRLVRICFNERGIYRTHYRSVHDAQSVESLLSRPVRQMDYFNRFLYIDAYMEFEAPQAPNLAEVATLAYQSPGKRYQGNTLVKINPSECLFHYEEIYPLSRCMIRNRWFPCPRRRYNLLSRHYGPHFLQTAELADDFAYSDVVQFGCVKH